jgi:hypothetical protein
VIRTVGPLAPCAPEVPESQASDAPYAPLSSTGGHERCLHTAYSNWPLRQMASARRESIPLVRAAIADHHQSATGYRPGARRVLRTQCGATPSSQPWLAVAGLRAWKSTHLGDPDGAGWATAKRSGTPQQTATPPRATYAEMNTCSALSLSWLQSSSNVPTLDHAITRERRHMDPLAGGQLWLPLVVSTTDTSKPVAVSNNMPSSSPQ